MRSRSITKTDPNYRHLLNRHIEKRPEIQHFSKLRGTLHNHPSGDPTPSEADITMTKEIQKGCKYLGLTLHDHIIVGGCQELSLRGSGKM